MNEEPEQPAVWGQLGASAIPERRKEEIRKQGARGDLVLLIILIPAGLFLTLFGVARIVFADSLSKSTIATIVLGLTALGASAKIILGRR